MELLASKWQRQGTAAYHLLPVIVRLEPVVLQCRLLVAVLVWAGMEQPMTAQVIVLQRVSVEHALVPETITTESLYCPELRGEGSTPLDQDGRADIAMRLRLGLAPLKPLLTATRA